MKPLCQLSHSVINHIWYLEAEIPCKHVFFFSFPVHKSLEDCIRIGFLIGSKEVSPRLQVPAELLFFSGIWVCFAKSVVYLRKSITVFAVDIIHNYKLQWLLLNYPNWAYLTNSIPYNLPNKYENYLQLVHFILALVILMPERKDR